MCTFTFLEKQIAGETAGVPPLSNKPQRVLFFTCEQWDHPSLNSLHTVTSHSQRAIIDFPPTFKPALLLSAICFAHRPGGGTEGEARKPPLAAQADGDAFTNPDWNTTINYGAPCMKGGRIQPARSLIKPPNRVTITRLNVRVCDFCKQAHTSFSARLRNLT